MVNVIEFKLLRQAGITRELSNRGTPGSLSMLLGGYVDW